MQRPVVVGMWDHEHGRERVGHEDQHADLAFADLEHAQGLLEYPQYTRPAVYREMSVPDILLSGHHAEIAKWRRRQSLIRTARRRPDLLAKADLTEEERRIVADELATD